MKWIYEDKRIYSIDDKGELMAEANLVHKDNGEIDIEHVYVNPALRGQGMAEKTMVVVADYLRKEGLKATATCSYANTWFQRNANLFSDIISADMSNESIACKIDGKH